MTTASIYYHQRTGLPDYVLIDGEQSQVWIAETVLNASPQLRRTAVDHACRILGWRIMANAPIVRQADGRGTVRVEPTAPAPDEAPLRHGVAVVRQQASNDEADVFVVTVAVDGQVDTQVTTGILGGLDDAKDQLARETVDGLLASMAYARTGPLVAETGDTWVCPADPADTGRSDGPPPADWRDNPALLRLDDETAAALHDLAAKLGIPADDLAGQWIRRSAGGALSNYESFTAPDSRIRSRIIGWFHDGIPRLTARGNL